MRRSTRPTRAERVVPIRSVDAARRVGYLSLWVSRILCHCMQVEEREVVATIRAGARSVDAVGERCDAGTGCGSCRGGIELLIQEEVRRRTRGSVPEALLAQLPLFGRDRDS